MNIDTGTLQIIGIVYSAISVAISLPAFIVLQTPTKSLIYLQIAYLVSNSAAIFSSKLQVASGNISLSTQANSFFCTISSFICTISFPVAFLIFTVGILVIFRLVTIPQAVRNKGLTYHRVHRWLKGLIRWMTMVIVVFSIVTIISLNADSLIPAVILLSACIIFPIVQLILYWKFPEPNSNSINKWLQFFDYVRIWLIALCISMAFAFSSSVPYYFIIVIILIYSFMYGYLYTFRYPIFGRVLLVIGDAMIVINLSMTFQVSIQLTDNYLDLFFLGILLICDIIFVVSQCVHYYRNRQKNLAQIVPEESEHNQDRKKRYEAALQDLNNSQQNFQSSSNAQINRSGVYKSRSKPLKRR